MLFCRNRRADDRTAAGDNIQLENDWTYNAPTYSDVSFDNPGFNENPIYDSISPAKGKAIQENIKQGNDGAMQELRFTDFQNEMKPGQESQARYQSLNVNGRSNPTYGLPFSEDGGASESGERYCVLTGGEGEEAYASLRDEGANHLQDSHEYLKPSEPQFKDSRNSPIYVDRESHA